MVNTKGNNDEDIYLNQSNERVPKFGQTRLRSLELMNNIFVLLHPSHGPLSAAQLLAENQPNPDSEYIHGFQLSTYVSQ